MIKHILFDVDSTLSLAPARIGDYFWTIIERLLLEQTSGGYTEVYRLIDKKLKKRELKSGDNEPVEIAARFGISEEALWRATMKWMGEYVRPVSEALPTVKKLVKKGFICHIASNNYGWFLKTKLGYNRLASMKRVKYFKHIFNASVIPHKKDRKEYYGSIMDILRTEPGQVVMIGDWPVVDMWPAREAGIENIIMIRRELSRNIIPKADGIYIKRLGCLMDILAFLPLKASCMDMSNKAHNRYARIVS